MKRVTILLTTLSIGGCAASPDYPSLLPRAVERGSFAEPEAPPPAPVVADPALDTAIAAAGRAVAENAAAFDRASASAERAVRAAARSPAGSDPWLDAQVALGELDTIRAAGLATITDLETRASDRAATLAPDYPALQAAIDAAQATSKAQAERIAALQAMLERS